MAAIEPQATLRAACGSLCWGGHVGLASWPAGGGCCPGCWPGRRWGWGSLPSPRGRLDDLTQRFGGAQVTLTASVEQVQEGYQWGTRRARLRGTQAGGEAADFCCWCEDLPACAAGEKSRAPLCWISPTPRTGRAATPTGTPFTASYQDGFVDLGPAAGFPALDRPAPAGPQFRPLPDLEGDEAGALAAMVAGDSSFIIPKI